MNRPKLSKMKLIICTVLVACSTLLWLFACNEESFQKDNTVHIEQLEQPPKVQKKKQTELKWPDATPPDTTDEFWEFNNNLSINGVAYHKVEVSPGKWQWTEDVERNKAMAEYENRKRELMRLLQSRVLTDKEMAEVLNHGRDLNIYNMEPFYEEEKQRELNEALLQQARLRQIEKQP